jgi:hypothetical protein
MTTDELVEIIMAGIMALAVTGVIWDRFIKHRTGLGVRAIQFSAVVLLIPAIVLLAIQGSLDHQALGTLLGAVAGYTLSNFGPEEKSN